MARVVLMGAWEIQQRLGISRQRAYQIIKMRTFPEPYQALKMGSVWDAQDVERWIRTNRPHLDDKDEA